MTDKNGIAPPGRNRYLLEALILAGVVRKKPGISWKDLVLEAQVKHDVQQLDRALRSALDAGMIDATFSPKKSPEFEAHIEEAEIASRSTEPEAPKEAKAEANMPELLVTLTSAVRLLLMTGIKHDEEQEDQDVTGTSGFEQMLETINDVERRYRRGQESFARSFAEFCSEMEASKKDEAQLKAEYEESKARFNKAMKERHDDE